MSRQVWISGTNDPPRVHGLGQHKLTGQGQHLNSVSIRRFPGQTPTCSGHVQRPSRQGRGGVECANIDDVLQSEQKTAIGVFHHPAVHTLAQIRQLLAEAGFTEIEAVSGYSTDPATEDDGHFCMMGKRGN